MNFTLLAGFLLLSVCRCESANNEMAFYKQMFPQSETDYSPAVRPVKDHRTVVNVSFDLAVIRLTDLNTVNGILEGLYWPRQSWIDEIKAWTGAAQFRTLEQFRVPIDKIWRPDIVVYDSVSDKVDQAQAVVSMNGTVLWVPKSVFRTPCQRDGRHQWKCQLKFGSWVYNTNQVDIHFDKDRQVDLRFYQKSDNLEIVRSEAERVAKEYPCCPGQQFSHITYTLTVKGAATFNSPANLCSVFLLAACCSMSINLF